MPVMTMFANRDCDKLPKNLLERYPKKFKDLAAAQSYVDAHSKS